LLDPFLRSVSQVSYKASATHEDGTGQMTRPAQSAQGEDLRPAA